MFLKVCLSSAGVILYFWGVDLLTSSKTLILFNLLPLFAGLLAWIFFSERLHYADGISLFVSFCGVFLIAYFSNDEAHMKTQTLGVFVMLAAATFLASGIVVQ